MHPCLKTMIAVGDIPVMSVSGELFGPVFISYLYLPPPRHACPGVAHGMLLSRPASSACGYRSGSVGFGRI